MGDAVPIRSIGLLSIGGFLVAYRPGTADEPVLRESFDNDIFFRGVPEYEPREDHVILDIGSHIGTFTLLAASKVPRGRVYSIEPCRESFNLLRMNVTQNAAANVDVARVALSDRKGNCELYYDNGNWGHSIVATLTGQSEIVPTDTMTNFLIEKNVDHCDFMKMNCEGAEFPIILSTPAEMLRRIRMMLVLWHCDLMTTQSHESLIAHLNGCGFETTIRNQTPDRGWIVARLK